MVVRKWQYDSLCRKNTSSSSRFVQAENQSKALDKALDLYIATWKEHPDSIELTCKGTYNFN